MGWEQVHTVEKYWDGPLQGVADFEGQPRIYERQFSEAEDEFTDRYWLTPIEPDLLSLVVEKWSIHLRWQDARHRNEATLEIQPLPEDRARYEALEQAIGDQFKIDPTRSAERRGKFRYVHENDRGWEVEWSPVSD
jgi:hypothetical protein